MATYETPEIEGQPNITTDLSNDTSPEIQKYLTDMSGLELKTYKALCGWRLKHEKNEAQFLGKDTGYIEQIYTINKKARFCNEDCGSFIANSIDGLVSPVSQSSKLTEMQIFNMWNGFADAISFALISNEYIRDEYGNKNSYEIKSDSIDMIYAFVLSQQPALMKSKDGFMFKALREIVMSVYNSLTRSPNKDQDQKGFFNSVLHSNKQ